MPNSSKVKAGKVAEQPKKSSNSITPNNITSSNINRSYSQKNSNDGSSATDSQISKLELQRAVANPHQASTETILALQSAYGNKAVARLLSNNASSAKVINRSIIQRDFVLPDTATKLSGKTPTYKSLKSAAKRLSSAVNKTITDDIDNQNTPVYELQNSFTPEEGLKEQLELLWSFKGADKKKRTGTVPEKKAQRIVNREQTVQYHLMEALYQEVADSTARRIKRNTSERIIKLRRDMAIDIAQAEEQKVAQGNDKQATKDYKTVILKSYQNQIEKQEKLAQSITAKVAFEVAKGQIKADDPLITQIIDTDHDKYIGEMAKPLVSKFKGLHKQKVLEPVASLKRKKDRLVALKDEIDGNPTMWDVTKRKYKGKLLEEFGKLQAADYKKNLIDAAPTIMEDLEKQAEQEAKKAADAIKTPTTELLLKRFNAGSMTRGAANNTEQRRELKENVTNLTVKALKNPGKNVKTLNAMGKTENKAGTDVIKKAKEESIKEAMDGTVHSKLRHVGKVMKGVIPQAGDKAKMELLIKAPVGDPHGAGYLGMRLTGQIEHDIEWDEEKAKKHPDDFFMPQKIDPITGKKVLKADTYKVRAELALIGGYRVPFVFDVGGEVGGYFEAESDKGAERAMELVSFGFYRRFRESKIIPHVFTDQMWGFGGSSAAPNESRWKAKTKEAKAWGGAFQESFSDKEYIENGALGAVTGSASISGLASWKGGLKGTTGKRYTKQTMDALARNKKEKQEDLKNANSTRERNIGRNISGAELSFDFAIGPFAVGGKIKGSWLENQAGANLDKDLSERKAELEEQIKGLKTRRFVTELEDSEKELKQINEQIDSDNKAGIQTDQAVTQRKSQLETRIGKLKTKKSVTDLQKAEKELVQVKKDRRLLKRQIFAIETEASAASKGGSFANASQLAAQIMQWSAELGAKVRTVIMSFKDQYAKDNKGKNVGSALFASVFNGIEAGVNEAKNFSQSAAEKSLESSQELVTNQMNAGIHGALNSDKAWDKMTQFALKNTGGMKFTFKQSTKRDFASADEGAKFSKNYPTKVEFILDQMNGGSLGTQIVGLSLERNTRLLRIGIKYKDGNYSLMGM